MKTTAAKKSLLTDQRGLASVEAIPLLAIFVMLTAYSLGMFGIVHTAILHSIAARTYAFETFRNRTDLTYFRENVRTSGAMYHYKKTGIRYHSVQGLGSNTAPQSNDREFIATDRPLALGFPNPPKQAKAEDHLVKVYDLQSRNQSVGVSPAWIMVGYGICLNAECGQ